MELEINVHAKGLTVFRGRVGFLGRLEDMHALLDCIRETFQTDASRNPGKLEKKVLIDKLTQVHGIPHSDACHFIDTLQQEGFIYAHGDGELRLRG